jgi:hypothetical protein
MTAQTLFDGGRGERVLNAIVGDLELGLFYTCALAAIETSVIT